MMNKQKGMFLLFAGSPILIGYGMDLMMVKWNWYGLSMTLISALFSIYWSYGGYYSYENTKSRLKANLLGNSIAIVCIGLILVQAIVLNRLLPNFLGAVPQLFFLPVIRLTALLRQIFFFLPINSTYSILGGSFLLMLLFYNIGYTIRAKKG